MLSETPDFVYEYFNAESKMFNLLVKYQSWGDGRDKIPYGRALEYTEQS